MKNYRKKSILALVLSIVSVSTVQAGTLTVINKIPDHRVQIFIRGENTEKNKYFVEFIEAGGQKNLSIQKENVDNRNTFEVIASTDVGGDPDWKLLGGKCANLVTDANHTIVIDSTAGKLSCTNVTPGNPQVDVQ